jgi:tRNA(Ile2) C34 agmatinyltransferase TiaS
MILKLQKWICPKCKLEWFTVKGKAYLRCLECKTLCDYTPNIWKVNEENY